MVVIDILNSGLLETFDLLKKKKYNKGKCNKTRYA